MRVGKSYGQFCALARALDHVGDRWTLLVVRELLLGPRTFRALQHALDAVAPNVLVDRLRALEADGLVERNDAPVRSKAVVYRLTAAGATLEPAVLELIRWGARWMAAGPGDDRVDPGWALLALRALLERPVIHVPSGRRRPATVHLLVDGVDVTVDVDVRSGRRAVRPGRPNDPPASVVGSMPQVLAVASGLAPFDAAGLDVGGDAALARAAVVPSS